MAEIGPGADSQLLRVERLIAARCCFFSLGSLPLKPNRSSWDISGKECN